MIALYARSQSSWSGAGVGWGEKVTHGKGACKSLLGTRNVPQLLITQVYMCKNSLSFTHNISVLYVLYYAHHTLLWHNFQQPSEGDSNSKHRNWVESTFPSHLCFGASFGGPSPDLGKVIPTLLKTKTLVSMPDNKCLNTLLIFNCLHQMAFG